MYRHYGSRVNHGKNGIVSADGNMCRHYGRQWQPLNIRDCVSWWKHVQALWKTVTTIEHTGLCQLMETCADTMEDSVNHWTYGIVSANGNMCRHYGRQCQPLNIRDCVSWWKHVQTLWKTVSTIEHTWLCQLMETCAGTMDHHIHVNSLHCWYPCLLLTRQHVERLFTEKRRPINKQNNNTTAIWFLEHETCMSSSLPRSC